MFHAKTVSYKVEVWKLILNNRNVTSSNHEIMKRKNWEHQSREYFGSSVLRDTRHCNDWPARFYIDSHQAGNPWELRSRCYSPWVSVRATGINLAIFCVFLENPLISGKLHFCLLYYWCIGVSGRTLLSVTYLRIEQRCGIMEESVGMVGFVKVVEKNERNLFEDMWYEYREQETNDTWEE